MAPEPDSICHWESQLTDTVCLPNKLAIFQISSAQASVVYFTAQSCLHRVGPRELDQNMPYLSPYYRQVLNSAKFRENVEIPQKRANSVAWLKILCSAENCGPSHLICIKL